MLKSFTFFVIFLKPSHCATLFKNWWLCLYSLHLYKKHTTNINILICIHIVCVTMTLQKTRYSSTFVCTCERIGTNVCMRVNTRARSLGPEKRVWLPFLCLFFRLRSRLCLCYWFLVNFPNRILHQHNSFAAPSLVM